MLRHAVVAPCLLLFGLLVLTASACSHLDAALGTPSALPAGGVPSDQVVVGGVQVRIAEAGATRVTDWMAAGFHDAVNQGFCIPQDQVFQVGVAQADLCMNFNGACTPGCPVSISVESFDWTLENGQVDIAMTFDVHADVAIYYDIFFFFDGFCDASFDLDGGLVSATVTFDPVTGAPQPVDIDTIDITGVTVSGDCGAIDDIVDDALNLFANLLNSFIGDLVLDLWQPILNDSLFSVFADPPPVEGVFDVGALTGTNPATLELRVVRDGWAVPQSGGVSLGVSTALNSDHDPSTRTTDLDSEPAACALPAISGDFVPTASSALVFDDQGTQTWSLAADPEWSGNPELGQEASLAVSQVTLDQLGHHLVASGALCQVFDGALLTQMDVGTAGLLAPPLAALGSPDGLDPLTVQVVPAGPVTFQAAAPGSVAHATASVPLTLALSAELQGAPTDLMVVGVTAEVVLRFEPTAAVADQSTQVVMVVVDLGPTNVTATPTPAGPLDGVSATELELIAGPMAARVLGAMVGNTAVFPLPSAGVFDLVNVSVGTGGANHPFVVFAGTLAGGPADFPLPAPTELAVTSAPTVTLDVPAPSVIRDALAGAPGGVFPTVTLMLPAADGNAAPLEYTARVDGGLFGPFQAGPTVAVSGPALAWQGPHSIAVHARRVGEPDSLDLQGKVVDVVLDSEPPRIHVSQATLDAGVLSVPVSDLVSLADTIEVAFGPPDATEPTTAWAVGQTFAESELEPLLGCDATGLGVWARDEVGNMGQATVDVSAWVASCPEPELEPEPEPEPQPEPVAEATEVVEVADSAPHPDVVEAVEVMDSDGDAAQGADSVPDDGPIDVVDDDGSTADAVVDTPMSDTLDAAATDGAAPDTRAPDGSGTDGAADSKGGADVPVQPPTSGEESGCRGGSGPAPWWPSLLLIGWGWLRWRRLHGSLNRL